MTLWAWFLMLGSVTAQSAPDVACRQVTVDGEHPVQPEQGATLRGTLLGVPRSAVILLNLEAMNGDKPVTLARYSCDGAGGFSLTVPTSAGDFHVRAWHDANGNGPSLDDSMARTSDLVQVDRSPIPPIQLQFPPKAPGQAEPLQDVAAPLETKPIREQRSQATSTPLFVEGTGWNYPTTSLVPTGASLHDPELADARQKYMDRQYGEARKDLEAILARDPDRLSALSLLSACLFRMHDLVGAERAARAVAESVPNPLAWSNLASVHFSRGDYPAAITAYQKALDLDSKHFLAARNLASAFHVSGDLPNAELALLRQIRVQPRDTYGYLALARVYAEQGRTDDAIELLRACYTAREIYESWIGMVELPLSLGVLLLRRGDPAAAKPYLEEALELAQSERQAQVIPVSYPAVCLLYLGHVARSLARPDEAVKWYGRVQEIIDANPRSWSDLTEVRRELAEARARSD